MVVKKYFINQRRDGYNYDAREKKYFSWGFDIWLNGSRQQARGFNTKLAAQNTVTELRKGARNVRLGLSTTAQTITSPTLHELFQKKLNSIPTGQERTRAKRVFTTFLSLLPTGLKVSELKTVHLNTFKESRIENGVSHSTIKRELVPVMECLNNADSYFAELENYQRPRKPKLSIAKSKREATIRDQDRRRIFAYLFAPKKDAERLDNFEARRRVGLFFLMCLLTTSRPGEIAKVKRTDVDYDTGFLQIIGTKTINQKPSIRKLMITPTMKAILDERLQKALGNFLFTNSGQVTGHMRKQLKQACEVNNIPYGKFRSDGIIFYTARHTSTTILAHSNEVDTKTAGDFTGHSDETMTLYYTHTSPETLKKASDVLESELGDLLPDREFLESNRVVKELQ